MGSDGQARVLAGTAEGVREWGPAASVQLAGHAITALSRGADGWWALVDGQSLWRRVDREWTLVGRVPGGAATCLISTRAGILVGTTGAHLLRLVDRTLRPVEAFESVEGRDTWYTPWGEPPDTRSLAADPDGPLYANVHVGGVVRSSDGGRSWRPTLDIETDVHQVRAHPDRGRVVLAAAAIGLGLSEDGGHSWTFATEGLHGRYLRAVAVAGDVVLVTASTGPRGRRAAVYRRRLGRDEPFERCRAGLPEWFPGHVDTHCLDAWGSAVALGTDDGRVFVSEDRGSRWELLAKGLPPVRCVVVGPA